jgi:hypothetical protein
MGRHPKIYGNIYAGFDHLNHQHDMVISLEAVLERIDTAGHVCSAVASRSQQ